MSASITQRLKSAQKKKRAWELHCKGVSQYKIAEEMGISLRQLARYIKSAATEHPTQALDLQQRLSLAEERWTQAEMEIRSEIVRQQQDGREVVEVTRFADGSVQQKVTRINGVDPQLLRALSTHVDRRNRQLMNQLSPDQNVTPINVELVQSFLGQVNQAERQLTAEDWNSRQTIDVPARPVQGA